MKLRRYLPGIVMFAVGVSLAGMPFRAALRGLELFADPVIAFQTDRVPMTMLRNGDASQGTRYWRAAGNVAVEVVDDNPSFVFRRGGMLTQVATISEGNEDLHVVLMARARPESVRPDGSFAEQASLYALALGPDDTRILGYLQGGAMSNRRAVSNEWAYIWGIFRVPMGTTRINFQVSQGTPMGVRYTGAAAWVDDVALYAVRTEAEAKAIVNRFVPAADPQVTMTMLPNPPRSRVLPPPGR